MMLFNLNERQVRDPENWSDIVAKYSTIIDGAPYFTLEQAYNLAKDKQIALRRNIQTDKYELTENDLINIAQYNPQVDWKRFLELKTKTLDDFLSMYPELNLLRDNILWDDGFYYAMNAETSFIQFNINLLRRKKIFDSGNDIAKPLLLSLYGSEENYLYANPVSIFEEYIFAYDLYIDDDQMIMNLAERMGISLNPEEMQEETQEEMQEETQEQMQGRQETEETEVTIADQMYIQLDGIFKIIKTPNGIKDNFYLSQVEDSYSLKEIINLTYDQFEALFKGLGLPHDDAVYINRLIIFLMKYQ